MLSVANFIMRGPKQAFIATLILSILTVWIAPLGVLVGAIIALVTLRVSVQEGFKVLLVAMVSVLAVTSYYAGSMLPGWVAVFEYMLPIWLLSWVH